MQAYSDANAIAHKFKSDEGISFSEYAASAGYKKYRETFLSYLNQMNPVTQNTSNNPKKDTNYLLRTMLKAIYGRKFGLCDDYPPGGDISGRMWNVNNPPVEGENGPLLCVDINGVKPPNRMGYDFFIFVFTVDGNVIPMGMEHKNNTDNTTDAGQNVFVSGSKNCITTGFNCAYYALNNKSPSDETKSYWKDFLR